MLTARSSMLPCKSIVCAVDEGDESEAVVRAAAFLAASFHAQLFLIRGVPTPPQAGEVDFSELRRQLLDAADQNLRELKARLGVDAPHKVTEDSITEAVHQEVLRTKAGLVVAGRGRAQKGFSRIWSLLYPIVREASCPVLSI